MRTLSKVIKTIQAHKEELEKKYNIKKLFVFGSIARGDSKDTSDVDIMVDFTDENEIPHGFEYIGMCLEIEKLLGGNVDVVRRTIIRAELKDRILKEAIQIW